MSDWQYAQEVKYSEVTMWAKSLEYKNPYNWSCVSLNMNSLLDDSHVSNFGKYFSTCFCQLVIKNSLLQESKIRMPMTSVNWENQSMSRIEGATVENVR